MESPASRLAKPRNRIWPSLKRSAFSNTARHAEGLRKGSSPSPISIRAHAPSANSQKRLATSDYFRACAGAGAGLAGAATGAPAGAACGALPRSVRKNSLFGSTTMTSDLLRKLAR